MVLEKTLESPLDYKEIQPVHPKGDQSWVFIGRNDTKAENQYFGHFMQRVDSFLPMKEISPEYSLEGLMLKLKLQYFGHLMQRTDSLEKTLMLGKIEGGRRRGQQRMR